MSISHKRTFFENIASFDQQQVAFEVKKLLAQNAKDNVRFDIDQFRRELSCYLSPDRVERAIDAATRPYTEKAEPKPKGKTGAEIAREQRKALKSKMGSRRKSG